MPSRKGALLPEPRDAVHGRRELAGSGFPRLVAAPTLRNPMRPVRSSSFASLLLLALSACAAGRGDLTAAPQAAPALEVGREGWRDREFDTQHIDFDLAFDLEKQTIAGTVTHRVVMLRDGLGHVELDSEDLKILDATVAGQKVSTEQKGARLRIALPTPTKAGQELSFAVRYEGSPTIGLHWGAPEPGYESRPRQVYSQGQSENNHFWIPMHDYPNDRATWSCTLHAAKGLTAVSNGRFVGVSDDPNGATRAWKYAMEQPNCTYLISVAVGPFERFADTWRGRPVEYFVHPGVGEEKARRSFGRTPEMLEFFSNWIGVEYAWPKYAQTVVYDFVVGGMENVSATTQTSGTLHDARSHLERDSEGLVSHELAHQWWGDLLTDNGWRHLWLNEGFATYFTALWNEHSKGMDDYRLTMRGQQQSFLGADSEETPRALVATPATRRDGRANAHVYTKGSSVLHMLRFLLGDEAFRRSIGEYCRRHALGLVETRDLERAVADVTGLGLEWFWQQWAYMEGAPKLEVEHRYDESARKLFLTVRQKQKVTSTVPLFRMPVDIALGQASGKVKVERIVFSKDEETFEIAVDARPTFVRFDEGSWIPIRLTHRRSVAELCAQAASDPDVVGRKEACERLGEALGSNDDLAIVGALATVLRSRDHRDVRVAAAAVLRVSGAPQARAALLAALGDESAAVRRTAADSLATMGRDGATTEALTKMLRGDAAYGPRASAIRALSATLGAEAWPLAEEALRIESENDTIARAALESMRKVDGLRALPVLMTFTKQGVPYELRETALNQCTSVVKDATLGPRVAPEQRAAVTEALMSAARSNSWRFRLSAIRNLGSFDDAASEKLLQSIQASSRDRRDRDAAKGALDARAKRAAGAQ